MTMIWNILVNFKVAALQEGIKDIATETFFMKTGQS